METLAALRSLFGFERFRPGQAEAVAAALGDRDALIVMPTGSGKSLCYQLPALMRQDLTLVVSPLVSLMQDQEAALSRIAPGKVGLVNSSRAGAVNAATVERAVAGEIRLLYVAPERFALPGFVAAIQRASVGLFAVDEAHCVSQWGHDFRPDYFTLADAARRVGARSIVALTATATPAVAVDIAQRLALRDPVRVTTGFDRPNLSFAVTRCVGGVDKSRRIAAALAEPDALPAIIYAGTRDLCETLARELAMALGVGVAAYHAGMSSGVRARVQEEFMTGTVPVIVATNAFGMGVDKADVRTVCHASVPGSLEAYYQEAGRAGRDGRPARCLLFAEQRDKGLHVFFIERARVPDGAFDRVSERLRWAGVDGRYDVELRELAAAVGPRADGDVVRAVVGHLARAGLVAPLPAPPDRAAGRVVGEWNARVVAACALSAREAEQVRWRQYRAIWGYVERSQCRRSALLRHFGDTSGGAPSVACCDVCDPSVAPPEPAVVARVSRKSGLGAPGGDLDSAILDIVRAARPAVGRTRAVEILRGGRSKVVAEHGYDELDGYGSFAHLRGSEVLERVDELLETGTLRSTGGRFPKLRAA
ncbi:MAG TPA: RecQ family ATP-dependent DNA helicase [Solirubrobacteraceae bacterium]|jgi:ATP-dependent DNA helicase RecQ|nr:RecQ family ATP-dependent DNA helicase [Solirubrobacteraceae bacterium]